MCREALYGNSEQQNAKLQANIYERNKKHNSFFGGKGYKKRITGGAKKNKANGPNVFVRLRATGVSEFSPFKKIIAGGILLKGKVFLETVFFFFFEFIHTWWLHYSPSPTAGQRAVEAARAEEVNASLKAFSVVISIAQESITFSLRPPPQPPDCSCWQMDLLLVKKK